MIEISVDELRANLKDCLQQVEQGKELVIRRRGKPIARIVPAKEKIETDFNNCPRAVSIIWGGKSLSPWEPVAENKGLDLISDLVSEERDNN